MIRILLVHYNNATIANHNMAASKSTFSSWIIHTKKSSIEDSPKELLNHLEHQASNKQLLPNTFGWQFRGVSFTATAPTRTSPSRDTTPAS
jgi:hypothetical protein